MTSYDVIVVGGGPAGTTVACLLAQRGINTLLLEEKRMPREKLCGAFITPECFPTLNRLEVLEQVVGAGAQRIMELRLVAPGGADLTTDIPAITPEFKWALSLSRSLFDGILFERARASGAVLLQGMAVKSALFERGRLIGVECLALPAGNVKVFEAPLVIDASGRNSRLSLAAAERAGGRKGTRLYAFKVHLQDVPIGPERLELYFFRNGYGGVSTIERGLVNLCFITSEKSIKEAGGKPDLVMERTIMRNPAAREKLEPARVAGKWLSAGPLSFGHRRLSSNGMIAVGDAAGMIDPFTGTGIQIALRGGEILAECIILSLLKGEEQHQARPPRAVSDIADRVRSLYETRYKAEFGRRMAVAGALRLAAFSPRAAGTIASLFARAPGVVNSALKWTRLGDGGSAAATESGQIMELSASDQRVRQIR
jgi:flavin-dependent dehydrogenase